MIFERDLIYNIFFSVKHYALDASASIIYRFDYMYIDIKVFYLFTNLGYRYGKIKNSYCRIRYDCIIKMYLPKYYPYMATCLSNYNIILNYN